MARGVAGAMGDLQRHIAEPDGVAVLQPPVGFERGERRETEHPPLAGQLVDPELVVDVRALDRHAVTRRVLGRLPAMIDVAVGEQHLLE